MTHTATAGTAAPVRPTRGAFRPLGLDEVTITGGFWAERQRIVAEATLPHIRSWLEREGWLGNFDLAASGGLPAGRRGREFADSEVYKYLEALAWEIGRSGDPAAEAEFRSVVRRVAAAQEPDGYLNTNFGRPGQAPRWSDLEWGHELYCLGHLFQAAVARARTRPGADDGLLEVAVRAADLVCEVFGEDGIRSVCGHPEIEPALVELGRVTGDPRYLEQARRFVERRGHQVLRDIEWGRSYFQDDLPLRQAEVLRGHAVRANYLAAGGVDVAVESDDAELLSALRRQWDNTVRRRTYITGGQGSRHQDEAFGDDWMLPPDRAYSETCAGVGSVMFSWRLLLADGDPRYADLIERTLFNVVATGLAADGRAFYYSNTLHRRQPGEPGAADAASPRAASSLRAPWFEVSCCPPNIARTFASLAGYLATASDDGIQLHQYAPSRIRTSLGPDRAVDLAVTTDYPRDGRIAVAVEESPETEWTLSLRVPGWAAGARVTVRSGDDVDTRSADPGTVRIRRTFRPGDVVELVLPMTPRVSAADPRIDAVRGAVAVERGPEVYCLESVDLPEPDAFDALTIEPSSVSADDAGGVHAVLRRVALPEQDWPYGADAAGATAPRSGEAVQVPLVPYHDWANRGPSAMRVWIPVAGDRG